MIWKKYKLSEITDIIGGGTPKTSVPEYWNGNIPWLSVVDFCGNQKKVYKTEKTITEKGLKESSTKLLRKGQLIISARGTVGELAMLGKNMAFNQSCYGLNGIQSKITNDFLYYLVKYNLDYIKRNTHGAVFDTITKQTFDQIEVTIPDLPTQSRIASILSSLDDKIELNRRMNQTLEQMAQALFNHYFVDNIDPDNLPKGWNESVFLDEFILDKGLSYKGSGLCKEGEGKPMHNLNSIYEGGGYKYEGIKFYKGEHKQNHLVKPWDVIVANTEQGHKFLLIGYPSIVPSFMPEGIFSHHIFRIRPKENSYLTSQFLYYLIMNPDVRGQIIGHTNGTTVNMLYKEGLQNPQFIKPPKELIEKFTSLIIPIWKRKELLHLEIKSLSKIRDTLLPKLMSGEIGVDALTKEETLFQKEAIKNFKTA